MIRGDMGSLSSLSLVATSPSAGRGGTSIRLDSAMSFHSRKSASAGASSPLERSARLCVISDSLAQPATLLFRHLLAQASSRGRALLVCFEHAPSTMLDALPGADAVAVVDASAPVSRSGRRAVSGRIDIGDEAAVRAAILQQLSTAACHLSRPLI